VLTFMAARVLLLVHTVVGVAAVGVATHLVLWLRRYLRGAAGKRRAVLKFAWLLLALQAGAFTAGALMYPTYKVEIRSAYLENTSAFGAEQLVRDRAIAEIEAKTGEAREAPATADLVKRAAHAARFFDIKEHWVALGMFVAAALVLVLSLWDPDRDGRAIAPIVMGLAVIAAGTVWFAAIVGVLTAAWRAV
jgi:hypothetical protein